MALVEAIKTGNLVMFEKVGVHKPTFDPNFLIDETGNFPLMYAC